MHTVHLPYDGENDKIVSINGFIAAAQGIIFDTKEGTTSLSDK
jgi:hypothetical protein